VVVPEDGLDELDELDDQLLERWLVVVAAGAA
jgi:hypothetical protein